MSKVKRKEAEVEEEVEDTPLFKCFRSPSPSILPSGENSPPVEFYSTLSLIQVCACTYPRFELPLFAEDKLLNTEIGVHAQEEGF